MFAKIDKKVLIILIVVLALAVLVLAFLFYKYPGVFGIKDSSVENSAGGAEIENNSQPPVQAQVQAIGTEGKGTITVCRDECGNGKCQESDSGCDPNTNLNCICPENEQECPQDCK